MNKWPSHASKISLCSTAMESRKGRASTKVCRRNQLLLGAIVKMYATRPKVSETKGH